MKTFFTFLFCTSLVTFSFAQKAICDTNSNTSFYTNEPYYTDLIKQRNLDVEKINERNDFQVQQVIDNCDFDIWQKRDILNNLEADRINRIKDVYLKCNSAMAYYNLKDKTVYQSNHFRSYYK